MHNIEITHTYPVPGYSYLPLDRCLGWVEKYLPKHETSLTPGDYGSVLPQHGTPPLERQWLPIPWLEIYDVSIFATTETP
jgi:hypothetical protein